MRNRNETKPARSVSHPSIEGRGIGAAAPTRRAVLAGAGAAATSALVPSTPLLAAPPAHVGSAASTEPSGVGGAGVEDAFRIRLPESDGPGVMDDAVVREHFARLRRMIVPTLPHPHAWRWSPADLVADEGLRSAVRRALTRSGAGRERLADALEATIVSPGAEAARAEDARQLRYLARPWPRVMQARARGHMVGWHDQRAATRCHQCWGRLVQPVTRRARAHAVLLIALDLPVPEQLADELLLSLAEEIACTARAGHLAGYERWTVRTGCLRAFGALIDRHGQHRLVHLFAHPAPDGPVDAGGVGLWALGDDRDLDGDLLADIGYPCLQHGRPLPSLAARSATGGPLDADAPAPRPTLVLRPQRHVRERDLFHLGCDISRLPDPAARHVPHDGPTHALIALDGPPDLVRGTAPHPDVMARTVEFVEHHRSALLDHWRGRTDAAGLWDALHAREGAKFEPDTWFKFL